MAPIIINGNYLDPIDQASELGAQLPQFTDVSKSSYLLIQTASPLSRSQKQTLADLNLKFLEEVSQNTFIYSHDDFSWEILRSLPFVTWTSPYLYEFKISPHLLSRMDQRLLAMPTYTLHDVTITFHKNVDAFSHSVQTAITAATSVEPDRFLVGEQTIQLLLDKEHLFVVGALDEVRSLDKATLSQIHNEVPVAIVHDYGGRDFSQVAENAHRQESPKTEPSPDPGNSQTFVEPFTLAWAAAAVAAGVLSWLGSKAIDSIFVGWGDKSVTLSEESIQQLAMIFAQTIAAAQLQEAMDKLRSLQLNVTEYNNAPSTSLDRLYRATSDSLDLLATLARLRWPGLQAYMLAGTLRCAILQERLAVFNEPGELLSLHAHIQQCFKDYTLAWYDLQERYNALSGPIFGMTLPSTAPHGGIGPIVYYFVFNHRRIGPFKTVEKASAALSSSQQYFYDKEIRPLWEESKNTTSAWQALRTEVRIRIQAAGLPIPEVNVDV